MPLPITGVSPISLPELSAPVRPSGTSGEFQQLLDQSIHTIETLNHKAGDAVQKFLTGENEEVHSTVMPTQEASLAFELGLSVRNKVVEAYQEVMRMQI